MTFIDIICFIAAIIVFIFIIHVIEFLLWWRYGILPPRPPKFNNKKK